MTSLQMKRRERYHGRGPERALEDVKGRGVVIVVDGVRGVSESPWLAFFVCLLGYASLALRFVASVLSITSFLGDATESMHSSTWMYDSET